MIQIFEISTHFYLKLKSLFLQKFRSRSSCTPESDNELDLCPKQAGRQKDRESVNRLKNRWNEMNSLQENTSHSHSRIYHLECAWRVKKVTMSLQGKDWFCKLPFPKQNVNVQIVKLQRSPISSLIAFHFIFSQIYIPHFRMKELAKLVNLNGWKLKRQKISAEFTMGFILKSRIEYSFFFDN